VTKLVGGFRKAVFPLCVFVGVVLIHFAWFCFFPEQEPAQSRWATITGSSSSAKRYIETQSYWLGYSYALAFSFAAVAFRAYRERRSCSARSMAIGGYPFRFSGNCRLLFDWLLRLANAGSLPQPFWDCLFAADKATDCHFYHSIRWTLMVVDVPSRARRKYSFSSESA
jgi:hypothetical protein